MSPPHLKGSPLSSKRPIHPTEYIQLADGSKCYWCSYTAKHCQYKEKFTTHGEKKLCIVINNSNSSCTLFITMQMLNLKSFLYQSSLVTHWLTMLEVSISRPNEFNFWKMLSLKWGVCLKHFFLSAYLSLSSEILSHCCSPGERFVVSCQLQWHSLSHTYQILKSVLLFVYLFKYWFIFGLYKKNRGELW